MKRLVFAALFSIVGCGLAVLHFARHADQPLQLYEVVLIGGTILTGAFLVEPKEVGAFVRALWPLPTRQSAPPAPITYGDDPPPPPPPVI